MKYGEWLRGKRRERGLSQLMLATLVGVDQKTVSNHESGRYIGYCPTCKREYKGYNVKGRFEEFFQEEYQGDVQVQAE